MLGLMIKDEKLDEFLKRTGIELLSFQREILRQMTDGNKIYICYPPNVGRTNALLLTRALGPYLRGGKNDAEHPVRSLKSKKVRLDGRTKR
jgi:hypothetical protein